MSAPLLDRSTALRLAGGWVASELVHDDGSRSLVLLSADAEDDALPCTCRECVPHEQDGRLPDSWLRRVGRQCAATKRNGERCRKVVQSFGDLCCVHRAESAREQ